MTDIDDAIARLRKMRRIGQKESLAPLHHCLPEVIALMENVKEVLFVFGEVVQAGPSHPNDFRGLREAADALAKKVLK